mgnify:CR=1 FL=1
MSVDQQVAHWMQHLTQAEHAELIKEWGERENSKEHGELWLLEEGTG